MCGINAIISSENGFHDLYESLYHLQHRGQDSFGISYLEILARPNLNRIQSIKHNTLLSNVKINQVPLSIGIGHVRYPTSGNITINECQPFDLENKIHTISIVHNGQIKITSELRIFFEVNNIHLPKTITSDSVYLLYLLSFHLNQYPTLSPDILIKIIIDIQNILEGSYNCICIIADYGLICFKDKQSIRPLIYGQKDNNYIISSESISLTSLDYNICGDIYGNDLLYFDLNSKFHKLTLPNKTVSKPCIFEWVYLAREESILYNVNVYAARVKMGEFLADKIKKFIDIQEIDLIVPIPDTSKPIALTISKILNIPYYEAITKNRYVNRTFIMNTQQNRQKNIKRKLNVVKHLIENKNIMIVDDSIVRGNTLKHIVKLLKENNVNKLFVVSSSPEIKNKNIYGIDIPDKNELLCYNMNNEEIEKKLEINKIIFQNMSDLKRSIQFLNSSIVDFETSIFE